MERLTEKFVCNLPDEVLEKLGIADIPKEDYEIKGTNGELCRETCEKYECDSCPIQKAIEKLADYEDAEEQGLLLRLPCKVGDTVYFVDFDENEYDEAIVESIEFGRNGFLINSDCEVGTCLGAEYLFLTQEAAEQALKQMGE